MAVHMKSIPTLRGQVGSRFIAMSEDNFRRRGSVDFSKEAANSRAILEKNLIITKHYVRDRI